MKSETRYLLENCLKTAKSIQLNTLDGYGATSVYQLLRRDLFHFMVYITMSDGKADREEVRYINKYLGYEYTPETLFQGVTDQTVFSDSFLSHPPESLEYFLDVEGIPGLLYNNTYYDATRMYYETFIKVGRELARSKGEMDLREMKNIDRYCKMLESNINRLQKQRYSISDSTTQFLEFGINDSDITPGSNRFIPINLGESKNKVNISDKKFIPLGVEVNDKSSSKNVEKDTFTGTITTQEQIEPLEELLAQLHGLIGLNSVKVEVENMINLLKVCEMRKKSGLRTPQIAKHLIFVGNPGTGKTTVARILSKIYCSLGILSKGQLVEVDRADLVAGYMGQTAAKVKEVVDKAMGGILFIDEAYSLTNGKKEGDFGQEAIDTLNKCMEDYRDDFIVIAAGYEEEMKEFTASNPGLQSRFNRKIVFDDYDKEHLMKIFIKMSSELDYKVTDDALQYVGEHFSNWVQNKDKNFGNARDVRNYLDEVINQQANRLVTLPVCKEEDLTTIILEDVMMNQ
ncbi:MAG: AAA family ATPase [Lachnospiraceae bacterium]|nr:AAA family ATPase [Lachnospiraceae bacterium]